MLKAGGKAPEFVLPDQTGADVSLTDLLDEGPLILYFYPADFTAGCTKEACNIRDLHFDIQAVGLTVVGVSPQNPSSHQRFREQNKLPFRLLSDPRKDVIKMYDVNGPLGIGVRRATFLINQDRTIEDAVLADVFIEQHREFIKKAISLREAASMADSGMR
jgi:peroxiredoxin Q/BCP